MTKSIQVRFDEGIQFPPKLGTLILKKTSEGKLAYAQNVNSLNDEYGAGAITPGPALTTIENNSELTGVPFIKTFFGSTGLGHLYFAQGVLGAKNIIRRVIDIISGLTPSIDTSVSITAEHSGHSNVTIVDMLLRPTSSGGYEIYVAAKDDSDTWVAKFNPIAPGAGLTLIATNTTFTAGVTDQFMVLGADNNIYWIGKNKVFVIDTADVYTPSALTNDLPLASYASAGINWRNNLVVAYSTNAFGDFSQRFSGGSSGLIVWDYDNANYQNNIVAPCRYISALVISPTGNLIVFGGVDEGKSTIYEFTGYGFNILYTYIGDLPRSSHMIEFDAEGHLMFVTADGHFCRYDMSNGKFDHLGKAVNADSAEGGLLAKGIGFPTGNEFLIAGGTGSQYQMKRVNFDNYVGDNNANDDVTTPIAVSGIISVPDKTAIQAITWQLTRDLQLDERVILLLYKNGNPIPEEYSSLKSEIDGSKSSKREVKTIVGVSNFSLGIKWKMGDNHPTAPAILPAHVEIS